MVTVMKVALMIFMAVTLGSALCWVIADVEEDDEE